MRREAERSAWRLISGMSWSEGTVTWNNWDDGGVTHQYLGSSASESSLSIELTDWITCCRQWHTLQALA